MAVSEESELDREVLRICQNDVCVEPSKVVEWVDKYGVRKLTTLLDEGIERRRGKLLNSTLVINLYTLMYKACSQSEENIPKLYEYFGKAVSRYLEDIVLPALNRHTGESLAIEFRRRWDDHKTFTAWMVRMFNFLDKTMTAVGSRSKGPCTTIVSMRKFCEVAFDLKKSEIVAAIQEMINTERGGGGGIDRSLLKSVVGCFITMGCIRGLSSAAETAARRGVTDDSNLPVQPDVSNVKKMMAYAAQTASANSDSYRKAFEKPFISNTREFYARKAREWIQQDSTSAFLIKAEMALHEEEARVAAYLHASTKKPLLTEVERVLLRQNQTTLLEKERSGMAALLEAKQFDDLNRMFRLFARVENGLPPMAAIFIDHFKAKGNEIVAARAARLRKDADGGGDKKKKTAAVAVKKKKSRKKKGTDPTDDPQYIQDLLDLHTDCTAMVATVFDNNTVFEHALKSAFEYIVHKEPTDQCTNAEVLCMYCDKVLKGRRAKERLNEAEVEKALDAVVCLFRYLKDKDMFAETYRHFLCKRLLSGKSLNNSYERSMITKLKMECGAQVTAKMEGMMANLKMDQESRVGYAEKWKATGNTECIQEFHVLVLQTGFWPTFFNPPVSLGPVLSTGVNHFKAFYDKQYSHRKLNWVLTEGRATLRCRTLTHGNKDFDVTTLQAIALLCFNEKPSMTFGEICNEMGMAESDEGKYVMKRVLHPLSCAKDHDILVKTPKSKNIDDADTFTFNAGFKHPKRMVVIHTPSLDERRRKIREAVDEDRLYVVDAAVVRVMKARRTMSHVDLITETLNGIRLFAAEPRMIKKRIETLIDRQYLARREGQMGVYDYLA